MSRPERARDAAPPRSSPDRVAVAALLLFPGAATVYLSTNGGGYFPDTIATATLLLLALGLLRALLAGRPLEGVGRRLACAAVPFAAFTVWTYASGSWSHAGARALREADRSLLYLVVLLLAGSIARTTRRTELAVRGLAAGGVVVCTVALATRLLPDVFTIDPEQAIQRLNYPLSYWNALGLFAAMTLLLCVYVASARDAARAPAAVAAAAAPLVACTAYFTFSRGALIGTALGLVVYLAIAGRRLHPGGVIAVALPTAAAVFAAYRADLLAGNDPTAAAAAAQGHRVAIAVAIAALAGAGLRLALGSLRLSLPAGIRRPGPARIAATTAAVAASLLLATAAVAGTATYVHDFFHRSAVSASADQRDHLLDVGNNHRIDAWRVGWDAFRDAPAKGTGAGTYDIAWNAQRPDTTNLTDAHSLYVETLSETGVVGGLLLFAALGAIIVGVLLRARGDDRAQHAAIAAVVLAWALHAAVDWDWEVPAVTVWVFALGGLALARSKPESMGPPTGWAPRAALVTGILALAVPPLVLGVAESRVRDATAAFSRGDCPAATTAAREASDRVGRLPEPYMFRGFCAARAGHPDAGVALLHRAVARDPNNWKFHYGLALMLGAAGRDPRPEVRTTVRLDPLEPLVLSLRTALDTPRRQVWRRRSLAIVADFDGF